MNTSFQKIIIIFTCFLLLALGTITEHRIYYNHPQRQLSRAKGISNLLLKEASFYGIDINITNNNSINTYEKSIPKDRTKSNSLLNKAMFYGIHLNITNDNNSTAYKKIKIESTQF